MHNFVYFLFYSAEQKPLLFFFPLACAAWILAALKKDPPSMGWLVCLALGFLAVVALGGLLVSGFGNNMELAVSAVSWNHQLGLPVYHSQTAPYATNMQYGPWLFLLEGWCMRLLGPSYFSAKLPAVLALFSAVGLMWLTLLRYTDRQGAWILLGVFAWSMLVFYPSSTAARGDGFIVLGTVLALWGAAQDRPLWAALWVGSALALLNGMKIHAPIFGLPGWVLLWRLHGPRWAVGAGVWALAWMLFPFALPGVGLGSYIAELRLMAHQGLELRVFFQVLVLFLWLVFPVFAVWFWGRPRAGRAGVLLPFIPAILVVMVLGSKAGSGSFHWIALMGPMTVALAVMAGPSTQWPLRLRWALMAFMLSIAATGTATGLIVARSSYQRMTCPAVDEFSALRAALPGIKMGMGSRGDGFSSNQDYWANIYTWQRARLTFAGEIQPIEEFSHADQLYAGRQLPHALVEQILSGQPAVWLVPRIDGRRPFDTVELYDRAPLYAELEPHFTDQFRMAWRGGCYELWVYKNFELSAAQKKALEALPQPALALYPSPWKR
jgi:hypothetical protein